MKIIKLIILSFSLFILASCANNREPLPKTEIVNTDTIILNNGSKINIITENAINGEVIEDTNNYLNVVSRSDTAKVVGLKVVQFAASLFSGGAIQTFTKDNLKGEYIDSVPNKTMDYLTPEFYKILKKVKANKEKDNSITIQPFKFKLIYDGLTNDKYNFVYKTFIRSNNFSFTCSDDDLDLDDKLKPISEWEANNYELVQNITLKAINTCMTRLNSNANIDLLETSLK